jgi:hypothetical protein
MGDVKYKLKIGLIMMVQANPFCGLPSEDANTHLQHFLELCDTIIMEGVTLETIRLHLFPFSLMGGQNSSSTRTMKLSTHGTSVPRYSS